MQFVGTTQGVGRGDFALVHGIQDTNINSTTADARIFSPWNRMQIGIMTTNPGYTLDVNGTINASGAVSSGGVALTSDRRVKKDIEDANLDMCLDNVKRVRLRRFAWDQEQCYYTVGDNKVPVYKDNHVLGIIADEFEQVFPKAIETTSAF